MGRRAVLGRVGEVVSFVGCGSGGSKGEGGGRQGSGIEGGGRTGRDLRKRTVSNVFCMSGILSLRPAARRWVLSSMNWYFLGRQH